MVGKELNHALCAPSCDATARHSGSNGPLEACQSARLCDRTSFFRLVIRLYGDGSNRSRPPQHLPRTRNVDATAIARLTNKESTQLHGAVTGGKQDCLESGRHRQLAEDIHDVLACGVRRYVEAVGDLPVAETIR